MIKYKDTKISKQECAINVEGVGEASESVARNLPSVVLRILNRQTPSTVLQNSLVGSEVVTITPQSYHLMYAVNSLSF